MVTKFSFIYRPLNNTERKQGSYSIVDVQPDRHEVRVKERNIPTAQPKVSMLIIQELCYSQNMRRYVIQHSISVMLLKKISALCYSTQCVIPIIVNIYVCIFFAYMNWEETFLYFSEANAI